MIKYELRPLGPSLLAAYQELLPHQADAIVAGKLEWKFKHNPAGPGVAAVAEIDGRVVGINTFQAARFRVDGKDVVAHQSMDTIVAPDARGQGVFARLVQTYYERTDAAVVYGFPNENSAPAFFGKLGWTRYGTVPFLIKPIRSGYFLKRFGLPLDFSLSWPKEDATLRALSRFERFERYPTGCAAIRDAEYLNWRLFNHPSKYEVLTNGEGFVATHLADKHGGRIGYIMEALSASAQMINGAIARMHQPDAVLAWCAPWSENYPVYRAAGFVPLPDRFRPISLAFGARNLRLRTLEPRDWYISYLDSDTV
jgi:GNAT superfamily N-acetyltransferase